LKRKGYTLTEVLVVLVIIATLAALAWPNYVKIQEKAYNREAKASLALIRAAEKIYRLEQGFYYPYPAGSPDGGAALINSFLKLSLPESASVIWSISINSTAGSERSRATRTGGFDAGKYWEHPFNSEDSACFSGTSCH